MLGRCKYNELNSTILFFLHKLLITLNEGLSLYTVKFVRTLFTLRICKYVKMRRENSVTVTVR